MSLRKSMKIDVDLASDGAWIDLASYPNEDGTIPGFLMARTSVEHNPKFAEAVQRLADRKKPANQQLSVVEQTALDGELMVSSLLLGWRNFEAEEDGVKLEYTAENAARIFKDPAWSDVRVLLAAESANKSNYSALNRELAAKNS